jgi:hypothetical protein
MVQLVVAKFRQVHLLFRTGVSLSVRPAIALIALVGMLCWILAQVPQVQVVILKCKLLIHFVGPVVGSSFTPVAPGCLVPSLCRLPHHRTVLPAVSPWRLERLVGVAVTFEFKLGALVRGVEAQLR